MAAVNAGNWTAGPGTASRSRSIRAEPIMRVRPIPRCERFAMKCCCLEQAGKPLVDVRSHGEYTGEMLHMPDYPQEGRCAAGHIAGAVEHSLGAGRSARTACSSRPPSSNRSIARMRSWPSDDAMIAYCRIGERSSHTWFVLKYLLGFRDVRNYDGSWTEWGNRWGCRSCAGESLR